MPLIHLTTFIEAPAERVFDLSRSIELRQQSMTAYEEVPINGVTEGLVEEGQTVTWKGKHLLKERIMTVRFLFFQRPLSFVEEQTSGYLKLMKHRHHFKPCANGTIMIDQLTFELHNRLVGDLVNNLYLNDYSTKLLEERNKAIKKAAEGTAWKKYLPSAGVQQ